MELPGRSERPRREGRRGSFSQPGGALAGLWRGSGGALAGLWRGSGGALAGLAARPREGGRAGVFVRAAALVKPHQVDAVPSDEDGALARHLLAESGTSLSAIQGAPREPTPSLPCCQLCAAGRAQAVCAQAAYTGGPLACVGGVRALGATEREAMARGASTRGVNTHGASDGSAHAGSCSGRSSVHGFSTGGGAVAAK